MFAFIASHLVKSFARYAAGSGISEIKSILAGFVMQGFLGFATFAIKSLTLVRPRSHRYFSFDANVATQAFGNRVRTFCRKRGSFSTCGLLYRFPNCRVVRHLPAKSKYVGQTDLRTYAEPSRAGKTRDIVTAASAAGVAVAFGAPIGGVLFSIEVSLLGILVGQTAQCNS